METFSRLIKFYVRRITVDKKLKLDDVPEKWRDEVEKEIMNSIIERVDLFTEKQKDGRWVRRIQFKIPLNIDGKRYDTVDIDDKDSFDKNSLPYATNDDRLVLVSHVKYEKQMMMGNEYLLQWCLYGDRAQEKLVLERIG